MFDQKQKYCNTYITDRVVLSGDKIEKLSYSVPIMCDFEREHTPVRDSANASEGKRNDSLARARQTVRRVIWENKTPHSKFLTLTSAETCLDVKEFRSWMKNFFRDMKRQGYELRYLYVLERQLERGKKEGNAGTIHAHIVVFNDEKIPLKAIKKAWKHGRTEIHILNELRYQKAQDGYKKGEKVHDVGAYVSKYITKEAALEWGSRCYNCSVGLSRPLEIPLKAIGAPDIGYFHDPEDTFFATEQALEQLTRWTYQNAKIVQYEISGQTVNQIIDYAQGTIQDFTPSVKHDNFTELAVDKND